jgi:beta-glucosidase
MPKPRVLNLVGAPLAIALALAETTPALSQTPGARPWMDPALSPDARADLLNRQLTLDERVGLVHGVMAVPMFGAMPAGAVGSIGFVPGIARLGVPALQETDAEGGIANPMNARPGDAATPLPSGLAIASSFDPEVAYATGAMVGHEAWRKGFNILLGGAVNLMREPRGGRNFEYFGEDPLLSGVLAGESVRGVQSQHVLSTLKHFPTYAQETGGHVLSVKVDPAALRESDLLAFEIALERGQAGSVLCAYDRIGPTYACDDADTLDRVLKSDWGFKGWVMSDWGATHSTTAAALNGLDQESGEQADSFDPTTLRPTGAPAWFAGPLKAAVQSGAVPIGRLQDMDRRILRAMFAIGLFDHPPEIGPIDYAADAAVAKTAAEAGIVLVVNRGDLLPLAKSARSIAVVGGEADAGVLSGSGSSQVAPQGGAGRVVPVGAEGAAQLYAKMIFDPSSPLAAIRAHAPTATVRFDNGRYPASAAALAQAADVAIVFANQWMGAGDAPDLSLPSGQDDLIAAVAAANPHTIVVLQTGGPVKMPWLDKVGAVVEAWYSGAKGGEAIADVLFGAVDASGRLPISFPASEAQLPRVRLPGADLPPGAPFVLDYLEGSDVGYRWYAAKGLKPLFPFGFGLSYTRFGYSGLKVEGGRTLKLSFDVANLGARSGVDTPQVYLTGVGERSRLRLIGWSHIRLAPGETRHVTVEADPRLLADYDTGSHGWRIRPDVYRVAVGASSADLKLSGEARLVAEQLKP